MQLQHIGKSRKKESVEDISKKECKKIDIKEQGRQKNGVFQHAKNKEWFRKSLKKK